VDLAHHQPFNEHNSVGIGGVGMDISGMFSEDEEFKPSGMLLVWFVSRTTTPTTTILWPFVRDYPGEPVPEGTFTHSPILIIIQLEPLITSSIYHDP